MPTAAVRTTTVGRCPHPNDFDQRRIERALKARKRYRYVSPSVATVEGGYLVESPCCSRNIDPDGGVVDIALMLYDENRAAWRLFRKNHDTRVWEFHSAYDRLIELLDDLNEDPAREFWQ